eukprot:c15980_g1_i1.p1 GENE.c15980_g1_i1~~c15980_g1_i1.p1  ORF type:complete len:156 (+),score=46.44 c15980_g1_i1:37-468(+)
MESSGTTEKVQRTEPSEPKRNKLFENFDTLEEAVMQSILAVSAQNQSKMLSSIIVCGGGAMTPGFSKTFEQLMSIHLENNYPTFVGTQVVVLSCRKSVQICDLAWRGAAVLANLEGCRDMWITRDEFERMGARVIRERAPFAW